MDEAKIAEIVKAERNAYTRAWRAKNPEKVKEHNAKYWRKRAERKLQEQQADAQREREGQA
ncbi:MAG: hypothetical protein LBI19_10815 [Oscillospiraceae bacterium]|jgi:hypothetical protein|nr:hypothetical protein [Oscillospiraceae bacterium]